MTSVTTVRNALNTGGASLAVLHPLDGGAGLLALRDERAGDVAAREILLDASLGAARFGKTSEILRAGRKPAAGLALVAVLDGEIVGTVRLWHVQAGSAGASLLLGPLAVADRHRALGIGGMLMREAMARAQARRHRSILLVGDQPYYSRFGFRSDLTGALDLPGPVDRARFLGLELEEAVLSSARGPVLATGVKVAGPAHAGVRGRRAA